MSGPLAAVRRGRARRRARRSAALALGLVAVGAVGVLWGFGKGAPDEPPAAGPGGWETLEGRAESLSVLLDPRAPDGLWIEGGRGYTLVDPLLTVRAESASSGASTTSYRLRFRIDRCQGIEDAQPWSACVAFPGWRPRALEARELLLDRTVTTWPGGESEHLQASCVPSSGAGPTCSLEASRVRLSRVDQAAATRSPSPARSRGISSPLFRAR